MKYKIYDSFGKFLGVIYLDNISKEYKGKHVLNNKGYCIGTILTIKSPIIKSPIIKTLEPSINYIIHPISQITTPFKVPYSPNIQLSYLIDTLPLLSL